MRIIFTTIKGVFFLALLLVGIGIFAGASHLKTSPTSTVETRCDQYNGSFKCETNLR